MRVRVGVRSGQGMETHQPGRAWRTYCVLRTSYLRCGRVWRWAGGREGQAQVSGLTVDDMASRLRTWARLGYPTTIWWGVR